MADPTNAEFLAAWLVHSMKAGEDGRVFPTAAEIKTIVESRPARYEEALALSTMFVRRVVDTEPRNVVEATTSFLREAHRIQEKFGGIFSAPPAKAIKRIGGR